MKVPYSYLHDQFADPEPILGELRRLVRSGDFTLGAAVAEFEEKFAAHCQAKYAVGVGTGTDALFLSLKALGIGPGDEVITCPFTFVATVGAIVQAGARPVFVDTTEQFVIDADQIERAVTVRTKAIMPVHYSGQPCDMEKILGVAKRHKLRVVEDACQSIGGELEGRRVGSWGDAAGFSLHPLKNLNVWGDGGIITTNSVEVRDRLRLLRNHGLVGRDAVEIYGYNCRLDTLQAIVGLWLFPQVEAITKARIGNAAKLDEGLRQIPQITVPARGSRTRHVYHIYMVMTEQRDRLLQYLEQQGVSAKVHYPIPMHLQKASAYLEYKAGDFPVAESLCQRILSLPVHQHLTTAQLDYSVECIRRFYADCA